MYLELRIIGRRFVNRKSRQGVGIFEIQKDDFVSENEVNGGVVSVQWLQLWGRRTVGQESRWEQLDLPYQTEPEISRFRNVL